ncbi:MAG: ring-cleaving dioxygenase [Chloroflexi bacterium]|nr:ring-cleaving dioxygenase [Chloroflexota bacterium]
MSLALSGIHHVTAVGGDPQKNVDFYTQVLGQRLVKKTVNFDDNSVYHMYYGDEVGHPGTIMTFFPFPDIRRGRIGNGQVAVTSYAVPLGSLDFWRERLSSYHCTVFEPSTRFGEEALVFTDHDGTMLELVATEEAGKVAGWAGGPVPAEHTVRSFYGVTLWVADAPRTGRHLTEVLGWEQVGSEGARTRYRIADGNFATVVDVIDRPEQPRGMGGAGTIHHVAFRTPSEDDQEEWQVKLAEAGMNVTPVRDRQYFKSIYYREPGGVLFEIATDPPGFTLDEEVATLGTDLKLPPWLEDQREAIAQSLLPVEVREVDSV